MHKKFIITLHRDEVSFITDLRYRWSDFKSASQESVVHYLMEKILLTYQEALSNSNDLIDLFEQKIIKKVFFEKFP